MLRKFLDREVTVKHCLERIRERDGEIRAWVEVSPQPPPLAGPLDGVPFGVKDIFETRGLATEYGSPIYKGRRGETDAALVEQIRRRGATMLGKTHTTAFAYFDPAPTRNPRNLAHTPGGSSSGSAAAVAAGMVPFALGTQTQGSVIRPASFCGICGFKPTFGLLSTEGVLPFAPSLDTCGLFTQTAADMALLWELLGHRIEPAGRPILGVPGALDVDPPMHHAFEATLARLRGAGFRTATITLPEGVLDAVRLVSRYEGARTHRERWKRHGAAIGAKLATMVKEGLATPEAEYRQALDLLDAAKRAVAKILGEHPVLVTPAAVGAAPRGLESTGDPRMNAPWTGLGVPAVTIPMGHAGGLPLG
ncbi:MAG: amidase, partial [Bryobacteraceae bacterium]